MDIFEIIAIGIGLAMDAFAVSICKGLSMKKMDWKNAVIIAMCFGLSHVVMPIMGYLLGTTFCGFVGSIDHWIAFTLLAIIGGKMIIDSTAKHEKSKNAKIDIKNLLALTVATSIDALAVGITFACVETNILLAVLIIGIIVFVISLIGVKIGNRFGRKLESKAELVGGIILILIGLKILLEHLSIFFN